METTCHDPIIKRVSIHERKVGEVEFACIDLTDRKGEGILRLFLHTNKELFGLMDVLPHAENIMLDVTNKFGATFVELRGKEEVRLWREQSETYGFNPRHLVEA